MFHCLSFRCIVRQGINQRFLDFAKARRPGTYTGEPRVDVESVWVPVAFFRLNASVSEFGERQFRDALI